MTIPLHALIAQWREKAGKQLEFSTSGECANPLRMWGMAVAREMCADELEALLTADPLVVSAVPQLKKVEDDSTRVDSSCLLDTTGSTAPTNGR